MATYPASPAAQVISKYALQRKTLITVFEDGSEQRRQKWASSKAGFELTYNALSQSEVGTLQTFFDSTAEGALTEFTFANPMESGSPSYTCRFADDESFDVEALGGGVYRVLTRLIEVF